MKATQKVKFQQEYKAKKFFEPSWDSDEICTMSEIIRTLSWYNEHKADTDAAKYLKCDIQIARRYMTYAWIERMISRGFKIDGKAAETFDNMRETFHNEIAQIKLAQIKTTQKPQNVISIQERVQAKTNEFIGELEGLVDEYGIKGSAKDVNPYQWMIDNEVKSMHASKIVDHFKKNIVELFDAEAGNDPDLVEGYSGYSKTRIRNIIACISKIIKDAERIAENQKVARKPRKKKAVPIEKQVSKLNYKERDDDFKIQSVNPTKIPGSSQVWVFNTKTRKLGVYYALDASGISVKGSSLMGYSTESIEKTLRKPDDILQKVTSGGKLVLRKLMSEIKSKSYELSGRINKDVIILRIV